MPGSGKSTSAGGWPSARVACGHRRRRSRQTTGRTIADIFVDDGEEEFRAHRASRSSRTPCAEHDGVLSLGGGAITRAGEREALAGHTVVYLRDQRGEGVRRTGGGTVRPLLAGTTAPRSSGH